MVVGKRILLLIVMFTLVASLAYAQHEEESTTSLIGTGLLQEQVVRTLQPITTHINIIQLRQSLANAPQETAALLKTGLSAGDEGAGLNAWGSVVYTDFEDDTVGAEYKGDGQSVSVGIDKALLAGKLVTGLSLAYDVSETKSSFNNGGTDTDSYTISPYASYMLNDTFGLDFAFGWGGGDTDMHRNDFLGDKNSGSQDSDHSFYSVGFSGNHWLQNLSLGWRVGYYKSRTSYDSYTETNQVTGFTSVIPSSSNKIGQASASCQIGYYLQTWMPYVKTTFEKEVSRSSSSASNDDEGLVWEAGVNFFGAGSLSGGAALSTNSGRGNYDNTTFVANLSYRF